MAMRLGGGWLRPGSLVKSRGSRERGCEDADWPQEARRNDPARAGHGTVELVPAEAAASGSTGLSMGGHRQARQGRVPVSVNLRVINTVVQLAENPAFLGVNRVCAW
jgi:hypothetical protein